MYLIFIYFWCIIVEKIKDFGKMKRILSILLASLLLLCGCTPNDVEQTSAVTTAPNEETQKNAQTEKPAEDTADDTKSEQTEEKDTSNLGVQEEQETSRVVTDAATSAPKPDDTKNDVGDDEPVFETDPYVGVNKAEFYANYKPAVSATDAYYRTQHFLMSGSIELQDQTPTFSSNRPMENGLYVRNTAGKYSEDGKTYYVVDANGKVVNRIYKDGAYVTLEEVAAYIFAFGEIPPNYLSKKSGNPQTHPWGRFLRVNHSKFIGNTDKYPYEPELPDISGCGGDLQYFELDIGTTGTDCDPSYKPYPYNDGIKLTRGAARIVYTRFDKNGNKIIDIDEKYLFYTNNHYNDFREYLNYQGGWGEIFGNVTGGGKISDKYNCNPTPYVETVRRDLTAA